jgi:serine/threonine protein kinase
MDLYTDSLASRIAREGPLAEPELVRIASDITRALGFAHGRGVIHRDLKPDNVLLRSDGSAVLSDFGIARAVTGNIASTGVDMTMGTPLYISPEQAQGRRLDGRADFYALGITLFKGATGDPPFLSTDWFELARMHVERPPPSVRARRPGLSKQFERIVTKCLAKHPDDRYQDAAALLDDLREIEGPAARGASTNGAHVRSGFARESWRVAGAVVLGAAVLLALALLLLRS